MYSIIKRRLAFRQIQLRSKHCRILRKKISKKEKIFKKKKYFCGSGYIQIHRKKQKKKNKKKI